jgi:hypothetical protein
MQTLRGLGVSLLAVVAAACSASSGPAGEAVGDTGGSGGTNSIPGTGGTTTIPGTGGSGGTGAVITGTGGSSGSSGDICGETSSKGMLVREPVDIIVVLDNSGSMAEEMGAAEANINVNFAQILADNFVDYRVILLSRHRVEDRTASEQASTSICVAAPLSGLAACPAPLPVLSERFYQYNKKVESHDSFDDILNWWDTEDRGDDKALAPNGWGPWLRPDAKKVFVEMTDDDEDMTADAFMDALTTLSPENFGTPDAPKFTFHSIVGVDEKANPTDAYLPDEPVQTTVCNGNGAVIENPGVNYQNLSIATGGLRFPLCQFPGYDAVFRRIAEDVIVTSSIDCSFPIPAPPAGTELQRDKIAVGYAPGDGSAPTEYLQASSCDLCEPDAFCIPDSQDTIQLCDQTCDAVQARLADDPLGSVNVLFKCETTIIPPH